MPDAEKAMIELITKVSSLEDRVGKIEVRSVNWIESAEHAVRSSPKLSMAFSLIVGLAIAWASGKMPIQEPVKQDVKEALKSPFSPKDKEQK